MIAALRLWWLLRSTAEKPRDGATTLAFGLATWALLSGARLLCLTRGETTLDRTLLWAVGALVLALGLTAAGAVRSLLHRCADRRLSVLRSAGASRAQTALVCTMEVADSALPGVLAAAVAHAGLWWIAAQAGIERATAAPLLVAPWLLLMLVLGIVVAARVRAATR